MLFSLDFVTLLYVIPVVLIALTIHEYAHAWAADKAGDPTPRSLGRLTLNPAKHINPIGAICMVLFGFGWANPVPINSYRFRNPRRDLILVSIAGPVSNLILSLLGGLIYVVCVKLSITVLTAGFLLSFTISFARFIYLFHLLNLSFCLFNLIPIPPLDGSRLITTLLPARARFWYQTHERQIYMGFLIWMLCGSSIYRFAMSIPMLANNAIASTVLKVLSLTSWLSDIVNWFSSLILRLFALIIL